MKLSIIIPVYRVEQQLERCIESILNQTFTDYELILIDDGSPDQCPKMCDEYALKDSRIRVKHQKNGGLSHARNTGLAMARGEYVTFIDSDDFIGNNTLSILMSRLSAHPDYDMLEYPVRWHYGSEDEKLLRFGVQEYHNMEAYWLNCKAYTHAYVWNKIFIRRLFDGIQFPVGRLYEDVDTLPRLLKRCQLVATTEEGIYYYTANPEGITMNPDGNGLADLLDTHICQLEALGISNKLTEYYGHVLNIQIDVYKTHKASLRLPMAEYRYSEVGRLPVSGKMKAKLRLLKLIGMKNLCRLSRIL